MRIKVIFPFSVLLITIACNNKKQDTAKQNTGLQPVIVDVIIAKPVSIKNIVEVNGSAIAYESVDIHPEINGRLTYLNIIDGGTVKMGELLAKVNDADLQAALNKSKVLLVLAQKTEQRLKKLLTINGINQADYDIALNQVNSLKADIEVYQSQIDKTLIKAPFNGVLGLRQISPGAYVTPQTILTTLQQIDKVKIDFSVPEVYASLIRKGSNITLVTNTNNTKREATIIALEPAVNATTRNIKVRALLKGSAINPGTFVKILLDASTQNSSILIPTNSIIPDARFKQIVIVKNGKGKLVIVETGLRNSGSVEITKGIESGDSVVVSGVLYVRPGSNIKVRSVKKLEELIE